MKKRTSQLTATFHPNLFLNIVATSILVAVWFIVFEKPKFAFHSFGIEFDLFCMFILFYVSLQMIMSLLNKHTLKPKNKQYVENLKVALIVPVYNEDKNSIREGLESCLNQTHPFSQIHVVDDGSDTDYSETKNWFLEECQRIGVFGTWQKQGNAGKREAHVNAISKIDKKNCDIVVTIDSDTVLDPHAVEKGLIPFQDESVMSVGGLVISKNVNTNLLTRVTDMLFVAHQRLIDRAAQGLVGQVSVNDGPLAFYRRRVIEVAIESGYTSETFRGQKVQFSDDSYFTLAAMLCGKTMYQSDAIAFTDMPTTFDHHRRQQLRWFRGSFIRGIWRLRFLKVNSFAWFRQFSTFFIFFSSSFILFYLLISHFRYTMQTMLPLSILCSFIYGLRYFSVKRSDVSFFSRFLTYLLTPFAILWSMVVLRVLRLYAIITNTKQKWGTRATVESLNGAKEFETSFKKTRKLRLDVEGLRAFAVVSVVIYHFFNSLIPGGFVGVDIFFVISGFIIITTVLNEIKRDGRFSIRGFYSRRIRRILPAATTVMVVGAILIYLWEPMSVWQVFSGDIIAATLYYINFALAFRGIDYMAQGTAESPFQHFWSLSVEEQFYFVSPIVMILVLLFAKVMTVSVKRKNEREIYLQKRFLVFNYVYLFCVIGIIAVSLSFCVYFTKTNPTMSYFVSPSRFWEMGIGCLIAVATALVFAIRGTKASSKRGRSIRLVFANIFSFFGIIGLFASLFIINDKTPWPSLWTLIPVLSAAFVILAGSLTSAGTSQNRSLVAKLLGLKPFVWMGALSYSLYLWHWMFLVVFTAKFGRNGQLTWWISILVILLSVACALFSKKFIEDPIRFSKFISKRKRITYSMGVILMVTSIVAALLLQNAYSQQVKMLSNSEVKTDKVQFGTMSEKFVKDHFDSISPNPLNAMKDTFTVNNNMADCFADVNNEETGAKLCEFGDLQSDKLIIVVGDSMARVWDSALDSYSKQNHFKVHSYTKSGCLFANALTENQQVGRYIGCLEWGKNALAKILEEKPLMVLSTQAEAIAYDNPDDPNDHTQSKSSAYKGIKEYWDQITNQQIPITIIFDTPTPAQRIDGDIPAKSYNINECVTSNLDSLSKCQFFPQLATQKAQLEMIEQYSSPLVSTVDMSKYVCYSNNGEVPKLEKQSLGVDESLVCPTVVGNDEKSGIDVYRDLPHLTDTFVKSISQSYANELDAVFSARGLISNVGITASDAKDNYMSVSPNLLKSLEDLPQSYEYTPVHCSSDNINEDTAKDSATEAKVCLRGDLSSSKIIATVGDSMMQQWESAIDDWGKKNGYQIHQYTKSACIFADAFIINPELEVPYSACHKWGENVMAKLLEEKPLMLITSQVEVKASDNPNVTRDDENEEDYVSGVSKYWEKLTDQGTAITFILKNPPAFVRTDLQGDNVTAKTNISDCLSANLGSFTKCQYFPQMIIPQKQKEIAQNFALSHQAAKVFTVDMSRYICYQNTSPSSVPPEQLKGTDPSLICPGIVGPGDEGIVVYRQGTHLTNTFVKSIAPKLWEQLDAAVEKLGE